MADNDASQIDRREIILPTARFGDYAGVPTRLQKQVARFWRDRPNSFADRFGNFAGASVMPIHSCAPGPVRKYADVS